MTINHFFLGIVGGLLMIFFLFQPTHIEQKTFGEIPLFQIENFVLHEVAPSGLITLMRGDEAKKYQDRYEVATINYTDNSKKFLAVMQAKSGIYKNDKVDLRGDVVYKREDGFIFETQSASYNKKTSLATTQEPYVAYLGANRVKGDSLTYNNAQGKAFSQNVHAIYYLEEGTK